MLFDESKTDRLRVSCVKNAFQNFAENEGTEYQKACKTAKSFLRTFENLTQTVKSSSES